MIELTSLSAENGCSREDSLRIYCSNRRRSGVLQLAQEERQKKIHIDDRGHRGLLGFG